MNIKNFLACVELASKIGKDSCGGILVDSKGIHFTNLECEFHVEGLLTNEKPILMENLSDIRSLLNGNGYAEAPEFVFSKKKDEKNLIRAGGFTLEYESGLVDEFPPMNKGSLDPEPHFTMPYKEFLYKIKKCLECSANERTHFSLHGVLFDFEKADGKPGSFVGTDGRRLTVHKGPIPKEPFTAIVPSALLKHLVNLSTKFKYCQEDVKFWLYKNLANFQIGDIYFKTMNIDGKYPDYKCAIPNDNEAISGTLDGLERDKDLKRAKKLQWTDSGEYSTDGKHAYIKEDGILELPQPGKASIKSPKIFDIKLPEGRGWEDININLVYMLPLLDGEYNVEFRGHSKAIVFKAKEEVYVLMPIVKK